MLWTAGHFGSKTPFEPYSRGCWAWLEYCWNQSSEIYIQIHERIKINNLCSGWHTLKFSVNTLCASLNSGVEKLNLGSSFFRISSNYQSFIQSEYFRLNPFIMRFMQKFALSDHLCATPDCIVHYGSLSCSDRHAIHVLTFFKCDRISSMSCWCSLLFGSDRFSNSA